MINDYVDRYGLTNSKAGETGAENGLLWTLQHILLEEKLGIDATKRKHDYYHALNYCRLDKGLFLQNPYHKDRPIVNEKDKYMSRDQLIAIMLYSHKYGHRFHEEIWREILKQGLFFYNNFKGDGKVRPILPAELCLYMALNWPLLAPIVLWITAIAMWISCRAEHGKTSGKLLAWTRLEALGDKYAAIRWARKKCDEEIEKTHGDWADVFEVYFKEEENINRLLSQTAYER